MTLISPEVGKQIKQALSVMDAPVRLVLFTQSNGEPGDCEYCAETQQLVEEIGALEDKLHVEIHDFSKDTASAEAYQVDKVPAIAVIRDTPTPVDYGIRLYGIPAGYEFSAFIEDILMVSREQHGLTEKTLSQIENLDRPVHIQVYTTPTWPYCPRAVLLAHKLAIASPWIRADMVEANEFPDLANRYQVYGVPRTVINEVIHIEGAEPESVLVQELLTVLDDAAMKKLSEDLDRF